MGKNTKNVVADKCDSSALNRSEVRWQRQRGSRHKYPEALLQVALAPKLVGWGISKGQIHEAGDYWLWTLNPYFDIRVAGNIGIPDGRYRDLGRLANCNPSGPLRQGCDGNDVALKGDVHFRAHF